LNTIRGIARNTMVLLIGKIITIVLTYFYTIYTARYLGAEGFGILSFAIAFTGISCLLADLGLSTLAIREISRNNLLASKYVGNILAIKMILAVITLGFTVITINLLGYPFKTVIVVYVMIFSTIFTSFTSLFNSIFQALQKMEYISLSTILNSLLMFVGTVMIISQDREIIYFASIYFLVNLIVLGYSIYICIHKFLIPKIEFDLSFWKDLLKESIPYWLTTLFLSIYYGMDMVMLSIMKGNEIVGWYAASYRLIDGVAIIPIVFMSVMYPIFSKYHVDSKNTLNIAFNKSLKYMTIIGIPIGIGTTILADEIIMFLYGNGYELSVGVLKILIWASVLSFISWTPATLLNSTNKQRTLMILTFIGAILNFILNYLLIPSLSYEGAGIATVITELVVGLMMLAQVQKTQNLLAPLFDAVFRSLISATAMGLLILTLKTYILLLIPLASIIYFISLFIVGGFEKEDFNLLKSSMKK
jgi:O-antigen/teichoic acid export membrane protein